MTTLRVWNIINAPNKPTYYDVETPLDGYNLIELLAKEQLKDDSITDNAFGLEVFEDGEWSEWYNEDGEDVDEAFDPDRRIELNSPN